LLIYDNQYTLVASLEFSELYFVGFINFCLIGFISSIMIIQELVADGIVLSVGIAALLTDLYRKQISDEKAARIKKEEKAKFEQDLEERLAAIEQKFLNYEKDLARALENNIETIGNKLEDELQQERSNSQSRFQAVEDNMKVMSANIIDLKQLLQAGRIQEVHIHQQAPSTGSLAK
jgi:gas vesicle protein